MKFALIFVCFSIFSLCIAWKVPNHVNISYSAVIGYFLQDLHPTNASTFDYTAINFGLINQTYPDLQCDNTQGLTQWQLFALEVLRLQHEAPKNVEYKVLFIGRHGEGYHNAAQNYYGTPGWNCYWAEINGNMTVTWEDAALTPNGIAQAQVAHDFWQHEINVQKMPTPESFYTSPLTRCLTTANITYAGLSGLARPFIPTIKEYLREGISIHTCDYRRNKTYIQQAFPSYIFEPSFQEYDILWNGVTAETGNAQNVRSKTVLDEIFSTDTATYISITTHSGEGASLLSVLGHIPFSLNTGAIIPVLVRAERQYLLSPLPPPTTPAWTPSPHCTAPPLTTASNGDCDCVDGAAPVTSTLVNDVYPATTTALHLSAYTEGLT